MPKKTSVKSETEQVTTSAPVVESVPQKKVRATKSTKAAKVDDTQEVESSKVSPPSEQVVSSPLPSLGVVESPLVAEQSAEAPLAEQSVEFLGKLQQLSVMISSLKTEYRLLEKKWNREVKAAQKISSKRKRKAGNRAPSGFVKPTKISDELASFLGKEKGTEMARTEVTRDINKYIRTNNLQDKDNGRKINPDSKLSALLKIQKNEELTYFNLQRYMSPHFAKANKDVTTATATATA
jgi:chromatin remodeling complex protein RSC6